MSLAGWATAGIASGVMGWVSDVMRISGTTELLFVLTASLSRKWSMGGLIAAGALCGAIGGAITGAAVVLQSRRPLPLAQVSPQDRETPEAQDRKLTFIAGTISGLAAALLCTFVAPLVVTTLLEGSLESLDVTIFFLNVLAGSPICILTYVVVSIPLGIAGGRAGLAMARARQGTDVRSWVWFGSALGGVAGCALGLLVAFAIGHTG